MLSYIIMIIIIIIIVMIMFFFIVVIRSPHHGAPSSRAISGWANGRQWYICVETYDVPDEGFEFPWCWFWELLLPVTKPYLYEPYLYEPLPYEPLPYEPYPILKSNPYLYEPCPLPRPTTVDRRMSGREIGTGENAY